MTAGGEQHDGGRLEVGVLQTGREQVALHVVDADERLAESPCHRSRERKPDDQSADQPRPLRSRNRVEIHGMDAGLGESAVRQRTDRLDVETGGDLGNDAAEHRMLIGLGGQDAGEGLTAAHDGHRRLVAARFDSQDQWSVAHDSSALISASRCR